jgi:hypothetical protein
MVASVAALQRRIADLNRQTRVLWQRVEERDDRAAPTVRRTALDLAAELGIALDPWQRSAVATDRHDVLMCVSRQGGKGTTATVLTLDKLLNDPGSTVVVVSKTERQAKRLFRRIRRAYRRLADAPGALVDTATELELKNGSTALALPGSEETIRGVDAVDLLIVDEAAVVPDELYVAVLPFLATTDGRQVLLSSARGRRGFFWRLYTSLGPWAPGAAESGDWLRLTVTAEQIPRIKPGFLARQRQLMGELVYRQEYGCEFLEDGATVFRRVQEAATAEPQEEPIEGHEYLVSVDWGDVSDWTVLIVWDATLGQMAAIDRFQQIGYPLQVVRLEALCRRFRPFALVPERNSMGDPIIQQVAELPWCPPVVLPFTTTNASKALAVKEFALALEQGAVRILDDPVLTAELQSFAAERLPSGLVRYSAPEGSHDDCVMAAIIGWHALAGGMDGAETVVYDEPVSISPI